jgi:hypothetical protein
MPDTATGGALSGAASGAAAGTAILPGWGTAIGAVVGGIGGALSAGGTADAQSAQNKAAAQQAAAQSAQSFYNYLASRGINLQQLVAQYPEFQNEYNRVKAAGEKRDFQTWLVAAIQADQSHPIWNAIANPAGTAGAANTTLPAWAVDANGNPLQPALLQQLVAQANGSNNPATAPITNLATPQNVAALFAANPSIRDEIVANMAGSDDARSPEQWLADHITQTEQGNGTFSTLLRNFAVAQATGGNPVVVGTPSPGGGVTPATTTAPASTLPGSAGVGNNFTLDPAITNLIPNATKTVGNIFNGTFLNEITGALKPIADARNAGVAAGAAKTAEQRALSGELLGTELSGINNVLGARTAGATGVYDASKAAAQGVYDANVTKLADLLGVRKEAAQQIYDASIAGAGGVRDARTTGATGIYGAEKLRADTYGQAAEQALSRLLAQQGAERARRGFTGGSSGSDIVGARLMADYIQRGAGERAQAGVNYQGRLSDAGVGYATDAGTAGVGRATTIGQSNEADAAAKLQAAVQLAQQLGLAGTTRATTLAGAGEQNAIAQLQAKAADATRRLGYLTSEADIAQANADLANANDQLNAIISNQNRMTSSIGTPFQLASSDLALKGQLTAQPYAGIDELLKRLNSFSTTQTSGPALTTSTPGSVLNGSQIAGGVLTGLGSSIGNTANNQSLADLIKSLSSLGGTGTSAGSGAATVPTGSLMTGGNYLGGASVFPGP